MVKAKFLYGQICKQTKKDRRKDVINEICYYLDLIIKSNLFTSDFVADIVRLFNESNS